MTSQAERSRLTRDQLVAIATQLFAERGYEDTSIEAVLHRAGVSRGAIYHHFAGKEGLFEAVLDAVEVRIGDELAKATAGIPDPVSALRAGCLTWISLAGDPEVRRILLIDAPSVLGWQRWRAIDQQHGLGMTRAALSATNRVPQHLVDSFAHMLLAALNEIAILVALADDPSEAGTTSRAAVEELLTRILDSNAMNTERKVDGRLRSQCR
jgi:AcrR family transcriptional regulator